MSVYVPNRSTTGIFEYDFEVLKHRFTGSTGKTNRRQAEKWEADFKAEKRSEIIAAREAGEAAMQGGMTLEFACARYWNEQGQFHSNKGDTLRNLEWLKDHFGATTLLAEIDNNRVAAMVAKRRGEKVRNGSRDASKKKRKVPLVEKFVSNGTVNRTATVPLREIMLRARDVWEVPVRSVQWKKHMLPERQERVREATVEEEQALFGELERGYDDAVQFGIRMGARQMEILDLDWPHINWTANTLTLHGKGDRVDTVPLPADMREFLLGLWSTEGRHPVKVFTYVAQKTRTVRTKEGDKLIERGKRYPLTKEGLKSAWRRKRAKAGVTDFRFHDLRHTAATRTLRHGKNLRAVQRLLRHADMSTTAKYAHAVTQDVADALDAVPVAKPVKMESR